MEDRVAPELRRPGTALLALVVILAITAAWWALALWPASAGTPEWLARTRAACFGSAHGGLPNAGGWILLVGEPLGMLGMLVAGWRRSLLCQLRWVRSHRAWRVAGNAVAASVLVGLAMSAVRVARASGLGEPDIRPTGAVSRVNRQAPAFTLVDQHGRATSLGGWSGTRALVTFAYGHCTTVCPAVVRGLQAARRSAGADIPIVVVTVDPWRDTPERLPMMAMHWNLAPNDRVLSGSVESVERTLDALGIGRRRDERTGEVAHAVSTMLLDQRGRVVWRVDGDWSAVAGLLRDRTSE